MVWLVTGLNDTHVVDPMCLLSKTSVETLSNFLLECATLESIRPILRDIEHLLRYSDIDLTDGESLLQLLTDCSDIVDTKTV